MHFSLVEAAQRTIRTKLKFRGVSTLFKTRWRVQLYTVWEKTYFFSHLANTVWSPLKDAEQPEQSKSNCLKGKSRHDSSLKGLIPCLSKYKRFLTHLDEP